MNGRKSTGLLAVLAVLLFPGLAVATQFVWKLVVNAQKTLAKERSTFVTQLSHPQKFPSAFAPPVPPTAVLERIQFPSKVGSLWAYITPTQTDGQRHPAVVWAHGGAGGIDSWLFEPPEERNDQTGVAFRYRGLVVMYPSWRGENDNPGQYEMFYGEVDDLLSARDFLKQRSDVDPDQVYLVGHSTGATTVALAACMDADFRAAFAFGPWMMLDAESMQNIEIGGVTAPFNIHHDNELKLRSAARWLYNLKRPLWYIEGHDGGVLSAEAPLPNFHVAEIPGGNHFDILAPSTALIADLIATHTTDTLSASMLRAAFEKDRANHVNVIGLDDFMFDGE
jgi:pimeloyl-ACP methyl ester carboxylesterase